MAILPFLSSGLTNAAAGASEDAALTGTPPVAQGPDNLAQLTKLLSGDLSGSLTGGDKLLALAALMRSATRSGRRAGLTPQQVMGQLQQQKVAELQNRMVVDQQRAKMAQEQQTRAIRKQIRASLTPQQQAEFDLLPDAAVEGLISKRLESQLVPTEDKQSQMARQITEATGFKVGSPEHQALMQQYLSQPQLMSTPAGIVQIAGIMFPKKTQPEPPTRIIPDRPAGLTDNDLIQRAREAIEGGADVNDIFRQLKAWGVKI